MKNPLAWVVAIVLLLLVSCQSQEQVLPELTGETSQKSVGPGAALLVTHPQLTEQVEAELDGNSLEVLSSKAGQCLLAIPLDVSPGSKQINLTSAGVTITAEVEILSSHSLRIELVSTLVPTGDEWLIRTVTGQQLLDTLDVRVRVDTLNNIANTRVLYNNSLEFYSWAILTVVNPSDNQYMRWYKGGSSIPSDSSPIIATPRAGGFTQFETAIGF